MEGILLTTAFLLLVSFLLHIVTITAIYQLVKQIKGLKQNNTADIAELMEVYLQEIKEENRMLETKLGNTNGTGEPNQKQDKKMDVKQTAEDQAPEKQPTDNTLAPLPLTPEAEAGDSFETSSQARILQLHDQGLSNEKIASQLHCGKTEVELVIKMHAKTDNNA